MAFRTNKMPVLQEKSASGSVASFNTALAMPLASCNIAVNAWQEGSGDPSPSNVRAIHGFSEVNVTRAGKNLFNPQKAVADSTGVTYSDGWLNFKTDGNNRIYYRDLNLGQCAFTAIAKSSSSSMNGVILTAFYTDGTSSPIINITTTDTDEHIVTGVSTSGKTISYLRTGFTNSINTSIKIQMSIGSTATPYEPYTGNTYTIQLGQEVYGAEVNVVNGVAHVTHSLIEFDGSNDENWNARTESGVVYYYLENALDVNVYSSINVPKFMCNKYKEVNRVQNTGALVNTADKSFCNQLNNAGRLWVIDRDITTLEDFKTSLSNQPIEIIYPLATPTESQITPTPINTFIGDNNIFADTGDIDLTFKDLDIAKRGNFREVFRLPS